ncbi:ester cyclase [Glacieibacterium frigidum]|uniref:Ester cyclase n=1 Tax=Glacieibacterium frigidum TaxID=2593303 RepID=A0A552UHP8_9SPHN|nr:ester cyclase [Glacieibacterium frigidum]TRW17752.1 ester cyclase [Glacieibacterium frigidum]
MSDLAALETAVRSHRAFDAVENAYLHRAWRDDDYGRTRGRAAIRDAAIAEIAEEGAGPVRIVDDLGDMIVLETAAGWRAHRWVRRDGERIVAETLIRDGAARARALGRDFGAEALRRGAGSPAHAPLGELRAGLGQFATTRQAALPHDFPDAARDLAHAVHRVWNGRAFGEIGARRWTGPDGRSGDGEAAAAWLTELFAALPDAVLLFERAIVAPDRVALLWRLHGHHLADGFGVAATGRRVRCHGSSVLTLIDGVVQAEDTLLDTLALATQLHRPAISYR